MNVADKNSFTFCSFCLTGFDQRYEGEEKLSEHKKFCNGLAHPESRIVFPKPGSTKIRFTRFGATAPLPLVLYADFEAIQISGALTELLDTENRQVLTTHECSGFAISPVFHPYLQNIPQVTNQIHLVNYSGENSMHFFFQRSEKTKVE